MGQSRNIMDIGAAVVILFIILFAATKISGFFAESDLKDYAYTTAENTTVDFTNSTRNVTHNLTVNDVVSITGKTATKTLTALVTNGNTTANYTVTIYLGGTSLGSFIALNGTNTSNTFTGVAFTASATNSILYTSDAATNKLYVNSTTIKYPSSKSDTDTGSIYTNLITNTKTVFDVNGLMLIIVALGVGIAALKVFGKHGSSGGGAVV